MDLWDFPLLVELIGYIQFLLRLSGKWDSERDRKDFPTSNGLQRIYIRWETFKSKDHPYLDNDHSQMLWTNVEKVLVDRYGLSHEDINIEIDLTNPYVPATINTDPDSDINKKAENLKQKANDAFKTKDYKSAIEIYNTALSLEGLSVDMMGLLFSNRAVSYTMLRDLRNGKHDSKCAITVQPLWFRGYQRLGSVYEQSGKVLKALKHYEIAEALKSGNTDSFSRQNELLRMQKSLTDTDFRKRQLQRRYVEGLAISSEGDKYREGIGCPKDLTRACNYYAKTALLGYAKGMFTAAELLLEGKDCEKNEFEAFFLLKVAARMKDGIEIDIGPNSNPRLLRNIGVAESQCALGKFAEGSIEPEYPEDVEIACNWFYKSLSNGHIESVYHLARIYKDNHSDIGLTYMKLGSYLGNIKTMNLLATYHLKNEEPDVTAAAAWSKYAGLYPIMSMILRGQDDPMKEQLAADLKDTNVKHLLQIQSKYIDDDEISNSLLETFKRSVTLTSEIPPNKRFAVDQKKAIHMHRKFVHNSKLLLNLKVHALLNCLQPESFGPTLSVEGLTPIRFKEMDTIERAKIYWGHVLKVRIIEDIVFVQSFKCLAKDEANQVFPLYVLYPKKKTIHEEIGFGCLLSLINPHFRIMSDGMKAMIVNKPESIAIHPELRDVNMCRCCWKGKQENRLVIRCDKCHRAFYCSEECKKTDEQELKHNLVCIEELRDYTI